jgi:hypothetical protein
MCLGIHDEAAPMSLDIARDDRNNRKLILPSSSLDGAPRVLGKITTASGTIGVGKFLSWQPVVLTGSEMEGGASTSSINTAATRKGVLVQGTASQNDVAAFVFVDYRWVTPGRSGGCNPGTTSLTFHIKGCQGTALSGVPVSVTESDGTVISGSTDASGTFVAGILVPGAYTYTYDPGPGLGGPASGSGSISCGQALTVNVDYSLGLTGSCCCNNRILPATLYATTSQGTVALNAGSSYTNSQNWNYNPAYKVNPSNQCYPDCSGTGAYTIQVAYSLGCHGATPGLLVNWAAGECPPNVPPNGTETWLPAQGITIGGPCGFQPAADVGKVIPFPFDPCTEPFPWTFTFPATSDDITGFGQTSPCPATGTIVIAP